MWNRFDRPLRIELGYSPLLLKALVLLHLAVVCAWLLAPLPYTLRVMAVGILLIQFRHLYRVHVRPVARQAVRTLYWESKSGWHVETGGGWYPATLCHRFYVVASLVAVRFRISRFRRVTVIVVADRTDADCFRRLRVRLLQCAHDNGEQTQGSGQQY